jgi:hypothetical protein
MKANSTFAYGLVRVSELGIEPGTAAPRSGKRAAPHLEVHGERLATSQRFWTSFFHRFGISETVFKYFDHEEVFRRIAERGKGDTVRYCIERDEKGQGTLLAVSNPSRPVIDYAHVAGLVSRYGGENTSYDKGVITSFHVPRSGDTQFAIGADEFKHRFVMDTPIDGFGQPKIYLSLLRMICSNGAIGYSPTFRSEIPMGKDMAYCIARALESYDNGDGFAALRQRFETAQRSWASLFECHQLYKLLVRMVDQRSVTREGVLHDFYRVSGNANSLYGLANLDALTTKRQRVLPARCRVYDLINFASELATHHVQAGANRQLQAYIGTLISDEYDMEGTADKLTDFADFFIPGSEGVPPLSVN